MLIFCVLGHSFVGLGDVALGGVYILYPYLSLLQVRDFGFLSVPLLEKELRNCLLF